VLYFFKNSSFNFINRININKTFLKPILEYGLLIGAHKATYLSKLQQRENIMLKFLLRCSRSTSTDRLLFLCKLENQKDSQRLLLLNLINCAKFFGCAVLFVRNINVQYALRISREYKLLWYMIQLEGKELLTDKKINIARNMPQWAIYNFKNILKE
jgi:hypothetical protein